MSARWLVINAVGIMKYAVTLIGILVFTAEAAVEVRAGQWGIAFISVLMTASWLWLFYFWAEGTRQMLVQGGGQSYHSKHDE